METCILADNQFVSSVGLYSLLQSMGVENILKAETVTQLQSKLNQYSTALVILDYTLFDFESAQQMLNLRMAYIQSHWLLFSDELSKQFIRNTLMSDESMSIVMKQDSEREIKAALHSIIQGEVYICDYAKQILAEKPANTESNIQLTASEKMILHEIALGKTTKEIAFEKHLSFHTVNSHRKNIYRKLEVNNLHEAIKYAIQAGLFDVSDYYI